MKAGITQLSWTLLAFAASGLAANTAERPKATLERLRGVLEKWLFEIDDQGRFIEPPEVAAAKGATKPGTDPNAAASKSPPKRERGSE